MSIDEKSFRIAQAHLLPGETLAWAGPAAAPRRTRLALLVGAATFLGVLILGTGGAKFDPGPFLFFVIAGVVVGGLFGVMVLAVPAALDRAHDKPTHYAITDRRILFLSAPAGETIPVASYGPEDIPSVRRRDRRDGTSDLVIGQDDGPRGGTVGLNGISVPFPMPPSDVALRGVADGETVEALIEALRSGTPLIPAAAPVAPVSPPDEPTNGTEIVFRKSATPWFAGAFITLFGLGFLSIGIASGLGPDFTLPFVFGGVGLLISLLGAGVLRWRNTFTADPATRTYQLLRGFTPFAKPFVGTFADFDRIRLTREDVTGSESPYKTWWHVRLHWKASGRAPYTILTTHYAPHGAGQAARMAAALGLPLDDRGAAVTPVEKKAQAVQADPRTPERETRRRRLKRAGGVALGLLLVNSFVKGVVYEDHWTAPDGSAITRRTTGFWWQTVAISPQGQRSSQTSDQYFFYTSSMSEGTLPDVSGPRTHYRRGLRLGGPGQ